MNNPGRELWLDTRGCGSETNNTRNQAPEKLSPFSLQPWTMGNPEYAQNYEQTGLKREKGSE